MRSWSQCVDDALLAELKEDNVRTLPMRLAERLRRELHREGYAIHETARCLRAEDGYEIHGPGECVRPGPPPVGRSLEEVMAERKES